MGQIDSCRQVKQLWKYVLCNLLLVYFLFQAGLMSSTVPIVLSATRVMIVTLWLTAKRFYIRACMHHCKSVWMRLLILRNKVGQDNCICVWQVRKIPSSWNLAVIISPSELQTLNMKCPSPFIVGLYLRRITWVEKKKKNMHAEHTCTCRHHTLFFVFLSTPLNFYIDCSRHSLSVATF